MVTSAPCGHAYRSPRTHMHSDRLVVIRDSTFTTYYVYTRLSVIGIFVGLKLCNIFLGIISFTLC